MEINVQTVSFDGIKQNISSDTLRKITQLKYKYNIILSKKTEFLLYRARQTHFESEDKDGKLLVRYNRIQQKQSNSTTATIQTQEVKW